MARYNKTSCYKCGAIRQDKQIGLEETPEEHIARLVEVFREVRRVLKNDATLWVNYGDTYLCQQGKGFNGNKRLDEANRKIRVKRFLPPKSLLGMPWRLAFALQDDGWILRQDIIWEKPSCMPESVTDRCTKSHEYIFLLAKSRKYYYDNEAIKEPCRQSNVVDFLRRKTLDNKGAGQGTYEEVRPDLCRSRADYMPADFMRNKRSVWSVATEGYTGAHFATFPKALIRPCIRAGSRYGGIVLDPFFGSGTTGIVALEEGRKCIGIELNPEYVALAQDRIDKASAQMRLPMEVY